MKKSMKIIISFMLAIVLLTVGVSASTLPANNFNITYNGNLIVFKAGDGYPFIDSQNRTQVPARKISETMNFVVNWDNDKQQVTISGNSKTIVLTVGSNTALVDNKKVGLDSSVFLKTSEGRVYIPLRFVTENMDCTVSYAKVDKVNTIIITSNDFATVGSGNIEGFVVVKDENAEQMAGNMDVIAKSMPEADVTIEKVAEGAYILYNPNGKPDGFSNSFLTVISTNNNSFEVSINAKTWTVPGLESNEIAKAVVAKTKDVLKLYLPKSYNEVFSMIDYSHKEDGKYIGKTYYFDNRPVMLRANGDVWIGYINQKTVMQ